MEFNICRYCGANNGRAGMLIKSPDLGVDYYACLNCYDTIKNGEATIHTHLMRTDDELQKTLNLINDLQISRIHLHDN